MKTNEKDLSPQDKKIVAFLREGYRNTDARAKFGCTWYRADKFRRALKIGKPTKELAGVSDPKGGGKASAPAKKPSSVASKASAKPASGKAPAKKPASSGKAPAKKPSSGGKGTVDAALL